MRRWGYQKRSSVTPKEVMISSWGVLPGFGLFKIKRSRFIASLILIPNLLGDL